MRDKFTRREQADHRPRITPAYAGQIIHHFLKTIKLEDHPRIRGTNAEWGITFITK